MSSQPSLVMSVNTDPFSSPGLSSGGVGSVILKSSGSPLLSPKGSHSVDSNSVKSV